MRPGQEGAAHRAELRDFLAWGLRVYVSTEEAVRMAARLDSCRLAVSMTVNGLQVFPNNCKKHGCPWCDNGKLQKLRTLLQAVLWSRRGDNPPAALLTLTTRHTRGWTPAEEINLLMSAWAKTRQSREWRELVAGGLWRREHERQDAYNHPHLHVIYEPRGWNPVMCPVPPGRKTGCRGGGCCDWNRLLTRWLRSVRDSGGSASVIAQHCSPPDPKYGPEHGAFELTKATHYLTKDGLDKLRSADEGDEPTKYRARRYAEIALAESGRHSWGWLGVWRKVKKTDQVQEKAEAIRLAVAQETLATKPAPAPARAAEPSPASQPWDLVRSVIGDDELSAWTFAVYSWATAGAVLLNAAKVPHGWAMDAPVLPLTWKYRDVWEACGDGDQTPLMLLCLRVADEHRAAASEALAVLSAVVSGA